MKTQRGDRRHPRRMKTVVARAVKQRVSHSEEEREERERERGGVRTKGREELEESLKKGSIVIRERAKRIVSWAREEEGTKPLNSNAWV